MPNQAPTHRSKNRQTTEQARGSSSARGYGHRWRKARLAFLKMNPICVECKREGLITPASEVDHVVAHRGNQKLFWDPSNWQALCKSCHSKKTVREDGGLA